MKNNHNIPNSEASIGFDDSLLSANGSFTFSERVPDELKHTYGHLTAELMEMGDFKMWRESLLNVLSGYVRACFEGDHHGVYGNACDVIELVAFFDRIEEAERNYINAKTLKP